MYWKQSGLGSSPPPVSVWILDLSGSAPRSAGHLPLLLRKGLAPDLLGWGWTLQTLSVLISFDSLSLLFWVDFLFIGSWLTFDFSSLVLRWTKPDFHSFNFAIYCSVFEFYIVLIWLALVLHFIGRLSIMCSFLLLFLVLFVIFDILQHSIFELDLEKAAAPTQSFGEVQVVFASQSLCDSQLTGPSTPAPDPCSSSFQGSTAIASYQTGDYSKAKCSHGPWTRNYTCGDALSHSVSSYHQENGAEMREMRGPLDFGHQAQYGAEATDRSGISGHCISRCLAPRAAF